MQNPTKESMPELYDAVGAVLPETPKATIRKLLGVFLHWLCAMFRGRPRRIYFTTLIAYRSCATPHDKTKTVPTRSGDKTLVVNLDPILQQSEIDLWTARAESADRTCKVEVINWDESLVRLALAKVDISGQVIEQTRREIEAEYAANGNGNGKTEEVSSESTN